MSATVAPQHKLCESPDCPACAPDPLVEALVPLMEKYPRLDPWRATRIVLFRLEGR